MKRFMILATAALISSGAFAQTATVECAPEQRTKIKQYVTTQKVAPVTVKEKLSVGATLPAEVRLSPVPADLLPVMISTAPSDDQHLRLVIVILHHTGGKRNAPDTPAVAIMSGDQMSRPGPRCRILVSAEVLGLGLPNLLSFQHWFHLRYVSAFQVVQSEPKSSL